MGDRKVTLFELHIDGETQFGPRTLPALLGRGDEPAEDVDRRTATDDEEDEAAAGEESGGGGRAMGALIALAVLVGLALAVRRYRGDDEDDAGREFEEPDVVVS